MRIHLLILALFLLLPFALAQDVCKINDTSCGNETAQVIEENQSAAPDSICIAYFYGEGCSNCAKTEPYIAQVEAKYGSRIHIDKYEIYHNTANLQLYNTLCQVQNIPLEERGVPLAAISDKVLMGSGEIRQGLEPQIDAMLASGEKNCPLDGQMQCHAGIPNESQTNPIIPNLKTGITIPLIIGTGLIDGINPCAFAVLIFLLTFLLTVSKDKKRMLKAGIAYIIAVYITYFVAGLGLLTVIHISGLSAIIVKIAAILAIAVGLINIKDFFWYGKGLSLKIPSKVKPTIEKWTHKANIPAALILGFLVAMFELPCTGGVYLAIIALLANTTTQAAAIGYLLLYNVMFVLPLFFIMYLVNRGMSAEHIENWRQKKKSWMKLAIGLILVGLGIAMLLHII